MINKYWNQIKYVLYFGAKYGHDITYIYIYIWTSMIRQMAQRWANEIRGRYIQSQLGVVCYGIGKLYR